jgi:ABC-type transport system involved in cytochrome c biogenesis permease subunit
VRAFFTDRSYAWARIVVLLVVAGVWGLLLAPQERSMGTTIRPVYLHVSATVAGMSMLYAAAGLGLLRTAGLLPSLDGWLRRIWIAGVVMFALGYALSMLAAQVAWGGIFWAEPRVRASVGVLAIGMLTWAVSPRVTEKAGGHLLWPTALAVIMVMLSTAQRIIHPESPVQDVTPWSIRGTFYGLTAIMFVVGLSVMQLMPAASSPDAGESPGIEESDA